MLQIRKKPNKGGNISGQFIIVCISQTGRVVLEILIKLELAFHLPLMCSLTEIQKLQIRKVVNQVWKLACQVTGLHAELAQIGQFD
jgi:hypothetical protein